jgi:hypothetical protein
MSLLVVRLSIEMNQPAYTLGIFHLPVVLSGQEVICPLAGPYALMLYLHITQELAQA